MSNKESLKPVLSDRVSDCIFTRCKHQDCDAISDVHKVYFEGLFLIFSCPCYALVLMPNIRNQHNFSTLHWFYIWKCRWILALLLVSVDWFKPSNSTVSRSKCILYRFKCIIWRPTANFDKMCTLHNMLHDKFGRYLFHICSGFEFGIYRIFIVPNLKRIHAIYTMLLPFQLKLVPRYSTGWSVDKLIWGV